MLFKKAANAQAYLKMGIQGFAGDGKTHTASLVAIGLMQLLRERSFPAGDRPVMFIDSETGSDWVKPLFDAADIELEVAKTRAFVDLKDAVRETEARGCVLIADSLTHFWRRFCDEYAARKERRRGLEFGDWDWLKREWGAFTDLYVNSQCHIILAGRAGYEYDFFERDDGKKELERTGVKMKAESETAFEPSLLVHMEKHIGLPDPRTGQVEMWRTATVLKDRSRRIDGRVFKNPTFADFRAHIECLNLGGVHLSVDLSRNNAALFQDDGKPKWQREKEMKEVALAEIADLLAKHFPGQASEQKRLKGDWLEKAFNSRTWERIQTMDWPTVNAARNYLWIELEGCEYAIKPPSYDGGRPGAAESAQQGASAVQGTASGEPPRGEPAPAAKPEPDRADVPPPGDAGAAQAPEATARLLTAPQGRRGFDADAFARQMQGAAERQDLDTLNALGEQLRDVLDEESRARLTDLHERLRGGLTQRQRQAQPPRRPPAAPARRASRAHAE
ncbi:AAA family ATPase [Azohydromonas australica]|uniref:AAA family ATPase n=1 Tax=Azohydromonas australica TaxID=364039 RepID=UPI000408E576|nr:AAA family ATPase [Azohydromonas australica]